MYVKYINLKNTPPSKPQSIELEIRPIFSTEGCDCTPPKRGSSGFVTQIRYTTPMKGMPSCSKTSHDHYYLHRSCVPDLCHKTRGPSFWGGAKQFFLVIYCSFKKRGDKLGGVMVLSAMAILFYRWSIPRKSPTCRKSDKLYP
jgi:hypothetical protein